MPPQNRKTWESFKPTGGSFEEHPRPTTGSRVYSALGTLFIGFLVSTAVAVVLMLFMLGISGRIPFLSVPGWAYPGVLLGAWAWTVWNWYQGLREEATIRERLDKKIERGEIVAFKARPPERDDEEDA